MHAGLLAKVVHEERSQVSAALRLEFDQNKPVGLENVAVQLLVAIHDVIDKTRKLATPVCLDEGLGIRGCLCGRHVRKDSNDTGTLAMSCYLYLLSAFTPT